MFVTVLPSLLFSTQLDIISIYRIMGSCNSQPRSLNKHWPTKNQMEHPFNHGHRTPNRSIMETYQQDEITRTAEDLFDRFDLKHNKVLNRDELLAFMRYAHKHCGNEKKQDFQLLCDLQSIFKKMGLNTTRNHVKKSEFIIYIRQLFHVVKEN